jgi:hypothetical protein
MLDLDSQNLYFQNHSKSGKTNELLNLYNEQLHGLDCITFNFAHH